LRFCVRILATDGQTDRQTNRQTNGWHNASLRKAIALRAAS